MRVDFNSNFKKIYYMAHHGNEDKRAEARGNQAYSMCSQEAENKQEVGPCYKMSMPTGSDPLPKAKLYLPNTP